MTAQEKQKEAAIYLSRYAVAKAEVRDIEQRIGHVRNEMMGVKGISYEGGDMPKQQNRTGDLSDYIARIDSLIKDWEATQVRAIETMREISAVIDSIDSDHARRILMLYFVDGKKYPEIQKIIPCGSNFVYKWRRIGLMEVYSKIHPQNKNE